MAAGLPRMRTIQQTVDFFKDNDPDTVVNEYHLRSMVKSGVIPVFKAGNKAFLNLDKLLEYFNGECIQETMNDIKPEGYGKIRRVEV